MLKYKIKILFIFIIMLCTFTYVDASQPCLLGKIIYVDPGHGGMDPGATYKELKESNINLEISEKLKEKLEKKGAKVYLTRNGDYDLSNNNTSNHKKNDLLNRAKIINESECDIFISIHLNSDPSPTWNGTQIFYTNKNKENKQIAQIIKQQIKTKRSIKEIKNMYLFDRITKPGILIEVGFISNSNDRYKITNKEYQQQLAQSITNGIIEYFK